MWPTASSRCTVAYGNSRTRIGNRPLVDAGDKAPPSSNTGIVSRARPAPVQGWANKASVRCRAAQAGEHRLLFEPQARAAAWARLAGAAAPAQIERWRSEGEALDDISVAASVAQPG